MMIATNPLRLLIPPIPQLQNDSSFAPTEEDIFSTQDKEFLSVLEKLQNANASNNIDSTTRDPTA